VEQPEIESIMEQWTYLVLDLKRLRNHTDVEVGKSVLTGAPSAEDVQESLQVLGRDGWELVQVFQNAYMGEPHYYFKRLVSNQSRTDSMQTEQ
jgi:hypothetical protein